MYYILESRRSSKKTTPKQTSRSKQSKENSVEKSNISITENNLAENKVSQALGQEIEANFHLLKDLEQMEVEGNKSMPNIFEQSCKKKEFSSGDNKSPVTCKSQQVDKADSLIPKEQAVKVNCEKSTKNKEESNNEKPSPFSPKSVLGKIKPDQMDFLILEAMNKLSPSPSKELKIKQRRSLSTPRRTSSHVRSLDFGSTPVKSTDKKAPASAGTKRTTRTPKARLHNVKLKLDPKLMTSPLVKDRKKAENTGENHTNETNILEESNEKSGLEIHNQKTNSETIESNDKHLQNVDSPVPQTSDAWQKQSVEMIFKSPDSNSLTMSPANIKKSSRKTTTDSAENKKGPIEITQNITARGVKVHLPVFGQTSPGAKKRGRISSNWKQKTKTPLKKFSYMESPNESEEDSFEEDPDDPPSSPLNGQILEIEKLKNECTHPLPAPSPAYSMDDLSTPSKSVRSETFSPGTSSAPIQPTPQLPQDLFTESTQKFMKSLSPGFYYGDSNPASRDLLITEGSNYYFPDNNDDVLRNVYISIQEVTNNVQTNEDDDSSAVYHRPSKFGIGKGRKAIVRIDHGDSSGTESEHESSSTVFNSIVEKAKTCTSTGRQTRSRTRQTKPVVKSATEDVKEKTPNSVTEMEIESNGETQKKKGTNALSKRGKNNQRKSKSSSPINTEKIPVNLKPANITMPNIEVTPDINARFDIENKMVELFGEDHSPEKKLPQQIKEHQPKSLQQKSMSKEISVPENITVSQQKSCPQDFPNMTPRTATVSHDLFCSDSEDDSNSPAENKRSNGGSSSKDHSPEEGLPQIEEHQPEPVQQNTLSKEMLVPQNIAVPQQKACPQNWPNMTPRTAVVSLDLYCSDTEDVSTSPHVGSSSNVPFIFSPKKNKSPLNQHKYTKSPNKNILSFLKKGEQMNLPILPDDSISDLKNNSSPVKDTESDKYMSNISETRTYQKKIFGINKNFDNLIEDEVSINVNETIVSEVAVNQSDHKGLSIGNFSGKDKNEEVREEYNQLAKNITISSTDESFSETTSIDNTKRKSLSTCNPSHSVINDENICTNKIATTHPELLEINVDKFQEHTADVKENESTESQPIKPSLSDEYAFGLDENSMELDYEPDESYDDELNLHVEEDSSTDESETEREDGEIDSNIQESAPYIGESENISATKEDKKPCDQEGFTSDYSQAYEFESGTVRLSYSQFFTIFSSDDYNNDNLEVNLFADESEKKSKSEVTIHKTPCDELENQKSEGELSDTCDDEISMPGVVENKIRINHRDMKHFSSSRHETQTFTDLRSKIKGTKCYSPPRDDRHCLSKRNERTPPNIKVGCQQRPHEDHKKSSPSFRERPENRKYSPRYSKCGEYRRTSEHKDTFSNSPNQRQRSMSDSKSPQLHSSHNKNSYKNFKNRDNPHDTTPNEIIEKSPGSIENDLNVSNKNTQLESPQDSHPHRNSKDSKKPPLHGRIGYKRSPKKLTTYGRKDSQGNIKPTFRVKNSEVKIPQLKRKNLKTPEKSKYDVVNVKKRKKCEKLQTNPEYSSKEIKSQNVNQNSRTPKTDNFLKNSKLNSKNDVTDANGGEIQNKSENQKGQSSLIISNDCAQRLKTINSNNSEIKTGISFQNYKARSTNTSDNKNNKAEKIGNSCENLFDISLNNDSQSSLLTTDFYHPASLTPLPQTPQHISAAVEYYVPSASRRITSSNYSPKAVHISENPQSQNETQGKSQ